MNEPREDLPAPDDYPLARTILQVAWPAFLVAGVAEIVFFTLFDPSDLLFFGAPLELSRPAMYTMGFFGFWGLGIAASALTLFRERRPAGRPPRMPE
jgi:hypothetical protein